MTHGFNILSVRLFKKMWNLMDLEKPDDVCQYGLQDCAVLNDLPNLVTKLTTAAEILTEENPIWTEIKVFQNVQAKYKRILHCDKCLLLLQQVGSCLRKMVLLNLSKSYLDLAENLLIGMQCQSPQVFIPSRQQLEYILIRTQSAAKIICEALHYSRETFCYLIQRLKVGHLVLNLMMATSVTARVNILFKGILVQIFDTYRNLYAWCAKLKKGTFEWPQDPNLPEDLEVWLQPEGSELLKPKLFPRDEIDFLTNFFDKKTDESDDDSVVVVSDSSVIECSEEIVDTSNDLGEAISRTSNPTTISKQFLRNLRQVSLTKSQKQLLNKITRADSLKKLKRIWTNLNDNPEDSLQSSLPLVDDQSIDDMFLESKRQLVHLKMLKLSPTKSKLGQASIIKKTANKLATNLGLVEVKEQSLQKPATGLKPVRTFKKLKKLYKSLYDMLESKQQFDKCNKLKRVFRSRKADIKLLIENNEKVIAKKLIFCTSKVFLARFQI